MKEMNDRIMLELEEALDAFHGRYSAGHRSKHMPGYVSRSMPWYTPCPRSAPAYFLSIPDMREKKRLLGSEPVATRKMEVYIALSGTSPVQFNFICSTLAFISVNLGIDARLVPDDVDACTHLIISADQNGLCPRTQKYLKCIVANKTVVGFMWYTELLDLAQQARTSNMYHSLPAYIRNITISCLVRGDQAYGESDAPYLAFQETRQKSFFRAFVISDPHNVLEDQEASLIVKNGGLYNTTRAKKPIIQIKKKQDFYNLISAGSKSLLKAHTLPEEPGSGLGSHRKE